MAECRVILDGVDLGLREGALGFCSLVLVEGRRRTLVDVGHVGRRRAATAGLAACGLRPADVDAIVLTHGHWDHVQNLDLFPEATVYMHPAERRYVHDPNPDDWATPAWTGAMLERTADRILDAEDGLELEPGVGILATAGHTVGSISVAVDTAGGRAVIAGDALQFASTAVRGRNPVVFHDDALARRSIQDILRHADVIFPGHDRPFRMSQAGEPEYLWDRNVTIVGADPTTPGLHFEDAAVQGPSATDERERSDR